MPQVGSSLSSSSGWQESSSAFQVRPYENELNFTGPHFPSPLSKIPKVERLNNLIINVFEYTESAGVHPLYLTKDHTCDPINLLLITKVED